MYMTYLETQLRAECDFTTRPRIEPADATTAAFLADSSVGARWHLSRPYSQ